jgi:hypothetical protein
MPLRKLWPDSRAALEERAGPNGLYLAIALAEKAHETIEGFPASTPAGRSAICRLAADELIVAAAQELGVDVDRLPD